MDIFYFKTSNSSFILTDEKILKKNFSVKSYYINNSSALNYVFALVRLFIFLSLRGWQPRIYFIRFADWHTALLTLFKKLYRRKLIIVVGGFDAFHFPEYAYGVYHRRFRGWCAKYSLRNANLVLPNSPYLIEYTNSYSSAKPVRGGIRYFVPDLKGKIKVVPNGFDASFWVKDSLIEKKKMVITVAKVNSLRNFCLKGIDSFIQVAGMLPDYKFTIVGMNEDFIKSNVPDIPIPGNLNMIEFAPHEQLLKFYSEAKVFCLLSLTEGMSNVLCEAMLCECIPVGSNVTFIPEMIGDSGFIVQHRDIAEMKQKVEEALSSDPVLGKSARQRVLNNFSLDIRATALCDLLKEELKTS
jgi:glycosyltransferase involved in cell wall biosynthesis